MRFFQALLRDHERSYSLRKVETFAEALTELPYLDDVVTTVYDTYPHFDQFLLGSADKFSAEQLILDNRAQGYGAVLIYISSAASTTHLEARAKRFLKLTRLTTIRLSGNDSFDDVLVNRVLKQAKPRGTRT